MLTERNVPGVYRLWSVLERLFKMLLFADDHNRVVIGGKDGEGEDENDYINASYIVSICKLITFHVKRPLLLRRSS